ncbi:MAG: VWA domain-containing protein [Elusimicrobiota bacterium]
MKKGPSVLAALLLIVLPLTLSAAELVTVAVTKFDNFTGKNEYDTLSITVPSYIVTSLVGTKGINVIERDRFEKVLYEQKLELTGLIDPAAVSRIGQLLSADFLVTGGISISGNNLRLDIHIINVKTGEIVVAHKAYATGKDQVETVSGFLAKKVASAIVPSEETVVTQQPQVVNADKVLNIAVDLSNPYVINVNENTVYARVGLYTGTKKPAVKRVPLNIALVIDRSGSMEAEKKLEYVKKAALTAINNLASDDIVSIIAYDTNVNVLYPASKIGDKNKVIKLIKSLSSGDSTNLSGGLEEGLRQVLSKNSKDRLNRVILLSDGIANVGKTTINELKDIAKKCAGEQVSLTAMGVGTSYDEKVMLALAEVGNGNYYFIDNPEKSAEIFAREFNGLLNAVAKNIKLCISPGTGCEVDKIVGYETRKDGKDVYITISNMVELETRSIVIRFGRLPEFRDTLDLAKVSVEYENVDTPGYTVSESSGVVLYKTTAKEVYNKHVNAEVEKDVELILSGEIMKEVSSLMAENRNEEAQRILGKQISRVINQSVALSAPGLNDQAAVMMQQYAQLNTEIDTEKSAARQKLFDYAGAPAAAELKASSTKQKTAAVKAVQEYGYAQTQQRSTAAPVSPGTASAAQQLSAGGTVTETDKQKIGDYIKAGQEYYHQKKFDAAQMEWSRVLVIDPDNELIKSYLKQLAGMKEKSN